MEFTVVDVELTATDLDGTVAFNEEETPGAYVHFNIDNDDSSNNAVGAPKRPGADCLNDTTAVTGENDLKALTVAFAPSLDEGVLVLTNTGSGDIWTSAQKGSGNLVIGDSSSLSWDLSDPGDRANFQSLGTVYVEGADAGTGDITLRYYAPGGSVADLDEVNYTFIAADCGTQPKTDLENMYLWGDQQWQLFNTSDKILIQSLGGMVPCEYSITDDLAPLPWSGGLRCGNLTYNCIAWSVNVTTAWYNPVHVDSFGDGNGYFWDQDDEPYTDANHNGKYDDGETYQDINGNGKYDHCDVDLFYKNKKGWSLITSGTDEEKAAQAEAMYYSGYHGARKRSCGCGSDKWIMYESKAGQLHRIEHVWDQLTNYGTPVRFYK